MASYEGMQAGGGWQQPMPSLETDYGNDEISEWLDIGPTVEEEAGWGVDEDEYTTGLDYSAFTPEQIRQAQMIAKQISHEQKQYGESRHFDRNMRDRRKQQQVKHDAAVGVHSAEDAIELLRRQKERQAQAPSAQPSAHGHGQQMHMAPVQHADPNYNEAKAVEWLRMELDKCANNIKLYGNPPPQHAARFLLRFGQELLQFLPNPPPDVKAQVLSGFAQVGWDVRIRNPLKGSHPPNGQQLTSLAYSMCCYFSGRNGYPLPPPESGIVQLPPAAPPAARPPQQHHNQHHRGQVAQALPQPRGGNQQRRGKGGNQYPVPKPRSSGAHYAGGGGQQNQRLQQPQQRGGYQGNGAQGGKGGRRRQDNRH